MAYEALDARHDENDIGERPYRQAVRLARPRVEKRYRQGQEIRRKKEARWR